MTEFSLVPSLICFGIGFLSGVIALLLFNKVRSGSASPESVKQQLDDYQQEVERHFEQTSQKFKSMTEQYQDLYNHLSIGATTLCRPDSNIVGLEKQTEIVTQKLEKSSSEAEKEQPEAAKNSSTEESLASAKKEPLEDKESSADEKSLASQKLSTSEVPLKEKTADNSQVKSEQKGTKLGSTDDKDKSKKA